MVAEPADTTETPTTSETTVTTETTATSEPIQFDDFAKVDLRVATIKQAEPHPNADRLMLLHVDDGTSGGRQILAGIRGHYEPEALIGRQIIIVANLAPRKMRGLESQGMLLAATSQDDTRVILLQPERRIEPGTRVG
jgi:methionyl-tRNA synthetase